MFPARAYDESTLARAAAALRRTWRASGLARWLAGEPVCTAPDTLRGAAAGRFLARLLPVRVQAPAAWPIAAGSRILPLIVDHSWLLLVLAMGYPVIDYALRSSPFSGVIANFWDEILLATCMALLAIRLLYRGFQNYRLTQLDIPICIYFGVFAFLFLVRSPDTTVGIEGLRLYVQYAFWYFATTQLCDRRKQAVLLLILFVAFATVVASYGIWQYIVGVEVPSRWVDEAEIGIHTRAFSVTINPNVLGSFLTLAIPLCIAFLLTSRRLSLRLLYLGALGTLLLCLLLTFSRGSWLVCLLSLFTFALLCEPRILAGVGILVLAAPRVVPEVYSRFVYLLSPAYIASSSRGGRLAYWQEALTKVKSHPLVGEGLGRFGGPAAIKANLSIAHVDNYYLKTAAEGGLIGLGVLIWLLLLAIRTGYQAVARAATPHSRSICAAILSGLVAVIFHNVIENMLDFPMMATLFWSLLGLLVVLPGLPE
ncbi:MAG: O-antigen ligase family protein [Bacillota bacterium]